MDWLRRNPLLVLLVVIGLLLAAVIAVEAGFGATLRDALRPVSGKPPLPADAKLLPPLAITAAEQAYPETVARPLFTPTRRPAPVVVAAPQSTFQKGQFVLAGVITVGAQRTAMLREKSNGRIHRLELGKEVNGIKVAEIQREQVTLAMGSEQEVLTLSVLRPPPGASLGPAAMQGPFGGAAAAALPPGAPPPGAVPPGGVLPSGQIAPSGPFFPIPSGGASPPNPAVPNPALPPGVNPAARVSPEASAAPLSPEELLARRRARRTQQNQNQ